MAYRTNLTSSTPAATNAALRQLMKWIFCSPLRRLTPSCTLAKDRQGCWSSERSYWAHLPKEHRKHGASSPFCFVQAMSYQERCYVCYNNTTSKGIKKRPAPQQNEAAEPTKLGGGTV